MKLLAVLAITFATSLFASDSLDFTSGEVVQTYQSASAVTGRQVLPDGHVLDTSYSQLPAPTYVSWPPRNWSISDILESVKLSGASSCLGQKYFLGLAAGGYFPGVSSDALMEGFSKAQLPAGQIHLFNLRGPSFVPVVISFPVTTITVDLSGIFVPVQQQEGAASAGASDQAASQ